jgi:Base plate wedge protein 53
MADISQYFGYFPKVKYSISEDKNVTESVTNIFKRYAILRDILSNGSSYVLYEIEDTETPELLAEKVYNDAGAAWIILYANQIIDPQFDWPLSDVNFKKYIIEKYGSISNAATTYHHYEKIVETRVGDQTYTRTYLVNKERLTENALTVPYTYFEPYSNNYVLTADTSLITADNVYFTVDHSNHFSYDDTSLPEYYTYEAHNVNDTTVFLNTYGKAVTNYDYELQMNDNKKFIKVIKAQYYSQIMNEFKSLTKSDPDYIRTL